MNLAPTGVMSCADNGARLTAAPNPGRALPIRLSDLRNGAGPADLARGNRLLSSTVFAFASIIVGPRKLCPAFRLCRCTMATSRLSPSARHNRHPGCHVPQPLSTGFTTSFQFRISNTGICLGCPFPADGLALVIQGDPAKTGALGYTGNGQNIAYGNNDVSTASGPGNAILNSLAIELDTHQNSDYSDPNGNHIAVQSCGPNSSSTLAPNSADHNYQCRNGQLAKLGLQTLPSGVSLSDGNIHTITVNYTAPGNQQSGGSCTSNLCVYLDSALLLQTNLDITQLLYLQNTPSNSNVPATGSYIGFTAATGSLAQNNDIISWSFSQLPLAPITITQPLQSTTTNFNYTSALSSNVDYSNSGLPLGSFTSVFMGVRAAAGHLVGQKVVGTGECYDLADAVLRDAGAKSAPDFGKVTKSRDQDYKWGTKIDLKDAKPGDILQFRNHQVVVSVVKKTTKTYPDGHSATTIDKNSTPYKRGQHTSIVLSNDGSGQMSVAEQHDEKGSWGAAVRLEGYSYAFAFDCTAVEQNGRRPQSIRFG